MDEQLDRLCALLDAEIQRQEDLRSILKAQQEALLAQDVPNLQARTAAMELLTRETAQAQTLRDEILRPLKLSMGLDSVRPGLSELVAAVSDSWSRRLKELQDTLRAVVSENRGLVRSNARLLRRSMRFTEDLLGAFQDFADTLARSYDEYGAGAVSSGSNPSMIDQRG